MKNITLSTNKAVLIGAGLVAVTALVTYHLTKEKESGFLGVNWGYLFGKRKHNTNLTKADSNTEKQEPVCKNSFLDILFGRDKCQTAGGNTKTL